MKRVFFGVVWAVVLYFIGCAAVGAIAGVMAGGSEKDPQLATQVAAKAGAEAVGSLRLVIIGGAVGLAVVGTVTRRLPGTKLPKVSRQNPTTGRPLEEASKNINWVSVVRDGVLVYVLTFLGGFILGLSGIAPSANPTVYKLMAGFLAVIALTISACVTKSDRLTHLVLVAGVVWLITVSNVFLGIETFSGWFVTSVTYVILVLFAWGLSYVCFRLAGVREEAK